MYIRILELKGYRMNWAENIEFTMSTPIFIIRVHSEMYKHEI